MTLFWIIWSIGIAIPFLIALWFTIKFRDLIGLVPGIVLSVLIFLFCHLYAENTYKEEHTELIYPVAYAVVEEFGYVEVQFENGIRLKFTDYQTVANISDDFPFIYSWKINYLNDKTWSIYPHPMPL